MPLKTPKASASVAVPAGSSKTGPANPLFSALAIVAATLVIAGLVHYLWPRKVRPSNRTPAPLPKDRQLMDYAVTDMIANGGTATVYLGEDPSCNPVAIKIPHVEQLGNREFAATFMREAEIGLNLRHPSIVRVLYVGSYRSPGFSQIPYFVMEHLEGQELGEMIHSHGPQDVMFAIMVARSVADALQWAHTRGVVHRDISPANIFISSKRLVKVMDFGISAVSQKFSGTKQSKGMSFGTPAYLAPERSLNSRSCDARSDLYALGCVLFEMLTGQPPYCDDNPAVVVAMHRTKPIPSLAQCCPHEISGELEVVVTKLLAKSPQARYQTAGEVVSALAELLQE
jgi:serine/threonine-protein kinase